MTFSVVKIVKNNDNVNVNDDFLSTMTMTKTITFSLVEHKDMKKFNDNVTLTMTFKVKNERLRVGEHSSGME